LSTVIAVANQKGGVGKTTMVANLGAALGERGQRVLVVDLDPQASLSLTFDLEEVELGVGDLLLGTVLADSALHQVGPNVDLLPAGQALTRVQVELARRKTPEGLLRRGLSKLAPNYDFLLLDCPPTLDLLTINALVAAEQVLVPLSAEYLSLRGLRRILGLIEAVQQEWNPALRLLGIAVSIYDGRSSMSDEVLEALRQRFGPQLFRSAIRYSAWLKKSPAYDQSLLTLAPKSAVAQDFRRLAEEVISRS
jgi:chromosome partitioning protein